MGDAAVSVRDGTILFDARSDGPSAEIDGEPVGHERDAAVDGTVPDGAAPDAAALDGGFQGPTRYPAAVIHSPITPWIATHLRAVLDRGTGASDVFMKVGASGTVSPQFLHCFAQSPDLLDFAHLQSTLDLFLEGDAAGTTPFDRETLAARVGRSAVWAITGSPSPLAQEMAAIEPAFALVAYGSNDMQLGLTHRSASYGFADNLLALVDQLLDAGIVPIVSGTPQRIDVDTARHWVPTYTAIARGIAQGRQVPFLDLSTAYADLPGFGLSGDGLHANRAPGGACVFTDEALTTYRANRRNLICLEALDRVRRVVLEDEDAPDLGGATAGDGSPAAPFVIDTLPWSDLNDTRRSPHDAIDVYPDCSDTDESGPEYHYAFTLEAERAVRIMVFDPGEADIDLHLLDAQGQCLQRAHQVIETTLEAGDYRLVLDSWTNASAEAQAGEYLLVVIPCEVDDADCR